jgi:hypothetical protein
MSQKTRSSERRAGSEPVTIRAAKIAGRYALAAAILAAVVAAILAVVFPDVYRWLFQGGHGQPSIPSGASSDRIGKPVASKPVDLLTFYSPSGLMGDIGDITWDEEPGNHLVRMTYDAKGRGPHEWDLKYIGGKLNSSQCRFAGIMLLDGDWGRTAGAGYDLRGSTVISWEARSLSGNVWVRFVAGGVNWVWDEKTGVKVPAPFPESLPDLQLGEHDLTGQWQHFEFPLDGNVRPADLRLVEAPFGWEISLNSNMGENGQPRTFFIIEVRNISYR